MQVSDLFKADRVTLWQATWKDQDDCITELVAKLKECRKRAEGLPSEAGLNFQQYQEACARSHKAEIQQQLEECQAILVSAPKLLVTPESLKKLVEEVIVYKK